MKPEGIFQIWAPDEIEWSRWAKPILFAELGLVPQSSVSDPLDNWKNFDTHLIPDPRGDTAVIVDLPGEESVMMGLALAQKGYRPVPLYNSCSGPSAVVNVNSIKYLLSQEAMDLQQMKIAFDARPAFLLDANRMREGLNAAAGEFDNRWMVFPQDFPSANFLLSRHIRGILLIQPKVGQPRNDLAHVLLRWQEAGVRIFEMVPNSTNQPAELIVARPTYFKSIWYRVLALMGLRRNSTGGFGSIVPEPSSSGSGWG